MTVTGAIRLMMSHMGYNAAQPENEGTATHSHDELTRHSICGFRDIFPRPVAFGNNGRFCQEQDGSSEARGVGGL